jgi:hypothetical protein
MGQGVGSKSSVQRRAATALGHITNILLPLLLFAASDARAAVRLVRPDGTGDLPTIQAALDASAAGDTVLLASGTFTGAANRDLDFRGRAILLGSQARDADACVVDCEADPTAPHRGLFFHSAEGPGTVVERITITRAYAPVGSAALLLAASPTLRGVVFAANPSASAGAVYVLNGSPALEGCIFRGNLVPSGSGGGFYCKFGGTPRLTGCKFFDNQARFGGALYGRENASPVLQDCIFVNNHGSDGGALLCEEGSRPVLTDCVFDGNRGVTGGAVYLGHAGDAAFADCELSRNEAIRGGAVFCGFAAPVLDQCRLTENTARSRGGAVCADSGSVMTLTRCTLAANQAAWDGGAIYGLTADLRLDHATLSGNAAADTLAGGVSARGLSRLALDGTIVAFSPTGRAVRCDAEATVEASGCDVFGNAGGDYVGCLAGLEGAAGNLSGDPLFCDQGGREFMLGARSPCATRPDVFHDVIGAWPVGCAGRSSDAPDSPDAPRLALETARPNPFTVFTRIRYALPEGASAAHLAVYDAAGRRVRGLLAAGAGETGWDGTDDAGRALPSGVYFCRLRAGEEVVTRSVTLLR